MCTTCLDGILTEHAGLPSSVWREENSSIHDT